MKTKNTIDFKFLVLSSIFSISTILLNIYCMKIIAIKNLVIGDGGFIVSWLIFLTNNLITENYGKENTINLIKITTILSICISIISQFLSILPVPTDYQSQNNAFKLIFSSSIRIILSSHIAFFLGNISYTKILSKYKNNFLSSVICQLIDNYLFIILAFFPFGISEFELKIIDILKMPLIATIIETTIERFFLFFF